MKNYKYTAIDLQKKKYNGLYMAKDEKDLAAQLARQNLFLLSCSVYSGKTPSAFFTTGTGKVSIPELSTFCRQMSIMLNTGVSVIESIEAMKSQAFSAFFKNILSVIYEDVKSGTVLSESLDKHKKVFPDFFRSMVHVGEVGGTLDKVFDALADYYEKDNAIRKKTKSALSYPIMLAGLTVAIVILMLVFIIPTFKETLSDLSVVPTGFTKFIYDASDFLVANWLNILAVIIVIGLAIFLFAKTKSGKAFFDKLALKLPLVGTVQTAMMTSRFARSFSLLLGAGMGVAEALEETTVVITNSDMKRRFRLAIEDVRHGMPLTLAFENKKLFPPIMLQMLTVGERTAELEDVLKRSCAFFDEQSETILTSATSKIQPVLLVIMGAVIGSLFLAVYSPMLTIMTTIV